MTRVLVETRLPLINWLRGDATLPEWILALEDLGKDSILVAGGNERLRRTLFENLNQLGSTTASAIIDSYEKLPRTNGVGVSHDFSLKDHVDDSMENALTNLKSSEPFRNAKAQRTANPRRTETVLESFDRIVLPLAEAASRITVVDPHAAKELDKAKKTAAKEIVVERFGGLSAEIRIHSVGPTPAGLPENVELILHKEQSGKKDIHGNWIDFPHGRYWRLNFDHGAIVINLDKGFDSFYAQVSGAITPVTDPNYWGDEIFPTLVATEIARF